VGRIIKISGNMSNTFQGKSYRWL